MLIALTIIAYIVFLVLLISEFFSYLWAAAVFSLILIFLVTKIVGKSLFFAALPSLFVVSSFLLLPFLAPKSWACGFIFFCAAGLGLLLFLRQIIVNRESPKDRRKHPIFRKKIILSKTAAVLAMYIGFAGLFAILENIEVQFWAVLLAFFIIGSTVSSEFLSLGAFIREKRQNLGWNILIFSLCLGMVALQLAWAIAFWPLGFFSLSIILLSVFFAVLDIAEQIIAGEFSPARALYNSGAALIAILLAVCTSKWTI